MLHIKGMKNQRTHFWLEVLSLRDANKLKTFFLILFPELIGTTALDLVLNTRLSGTFRWVEMLSALYCVRIAVASN